jgi:hypothetical protein
MGGSAPGKFKAETNERSRGNNPENFGNTSGTQFNPEGYEITPMEAMRHADVFDAFAFPEGTMSAQGNPYGATDYMGPTYASKPTGMYNIPRVGATVTVQFVNGDLNKPIITGHMIDTQSAEEIFKDGDVEIAQPGSFENP